MPRRKAEETMTDKRRKFLAEEILVLIEQGKNRAEAWRLTHPESTAKPESMRVMCSNLLAWYNEKYPTGYEQLMRRLKAQERRRNRRRVRPQESHHQGGRHARDQAAAPMQPETDEERLEELLLDRELEGDEAPPWVDEEIAKLRAKGVRARQQRDPDPPPTDEGTRGT